jgi:hypothetical protein
MVYFGFTDFLEDRLQCGEVPMNIVDCSDPHDRPSHRLRTADTIMILLHHNNLPQPQLAYLVRNQIARDHWVGELPGRCEVDRDGAQ